MTTSLDEPLDVRRKGAALWLTLHRPDAGNGINDDVVGAIRHALDDAERADDVAAVVIAAAGDIFCAGADLKALKGMTSQRGGQATAALMAFLARVGQLLERMESLPKPIIAAVDGLAVAGGLEIVLACDLVVATTAARFGDAHANFGLLPGGGGSVRLPRRVGPSLAKYLMFTGRTLPAADLAATDLITVLVAEDADLRTTVDSIVADIAARSPRGIRVMKELVHGGLDPAPADARATELAAVAEHTTSADFAEGLQAFNDKRRPEFTGR